MFGKSLDKKITAKNFTRKNRKRNLLDNIKKNIKCCASIKTINILSGKVETPKNIWSLLIKYFSNNKNDIFIVDSKYYIPDEKSIKKIIDNFNYSNYKYSKNSMDCDFFSLAFVMNSYLSLNKILDLHESGLPIGRITFTYTKNNKKAGHSMNICIYQSDNGNLELLIVEPQAGKLYTYKEFIEHYERTTILYIEI